MYTMFHFLMGEYLLKDNTGIRTTEDINIKTKDTKSFSEATLIAPTKKKYKKLK